jgi:hypothetical protein
MAKLILVGKGWSHWQRSWGRQLPKSAARAERLRKTARKVFPV